MRKRLIHGATALSLALTLGTFGVTGVALAGEDDPAAPPPPAPVEPAPQPTTPQPVPVTPPPAPTPAPTPAPVPTPKKATVKKAVKKSSSSSSSSSSSPSTSPVAQTTVDTGTVPTGGIQAGAGGTAAHAGSPLLLALVLGMLAFGVTSGGIALRRRSAER